jgi:predicted lactoylglutathione lyase
MQNKKQIYVNLPVSDLVKSEAFYTALGFVKNPMFSNEDASSMNWSEEIMVMLLKKSMYQTFLNDKKIGDAKINSSVLLALSMNSKEEVQAFADTAKALGGDYFMAEPVKECLDFMFCYEVSDPDGHTWEPGYMDISKFPQQN